MAIIEAREVSDSRTTQTTRQSGITVAVTSPAIAVAQSAITTTQAIGKTGDGRMKALGAASALMSANTALGKLASEDPKEAGINASLSIGSSQSTNTTTAHSDTARGSKVTGQNVSITATGAGQDSNILIRGSDITGSKTVALAADNQVDIVSAQSTSEQHSQNSSSSASLGVSYGTDGLLFTASASGARGKADGSDVTQVSSHVSGADRVSIKSGGDTNILGGVVKGNRAVTDIGGDLNIESRQDTAKFDSKQQSLGGSASVGAGKVGGSLSVSQSQVNADYASVNERSGIQAGDGGFDVKVKGKTDLVGGAISSTQKAVDEGKNSFDTKSLTTRDIQNRDNFNASGFSLSGGYSTGGTGQPGGDGKPAPNLAGGVNGAAAGIASTSGKNSSTTTSGIAGDKEVRTGDSSGGLAKTFDADKVNKEVAAQLQTTSTFGQQAAKAAGDFANGKAKELRAQGNEAEAANWDEGGTYRVAMHTVLAGLTGGVQGALGAASSQLAIDAVGKQVAATDLPLGLKTALVAAAGTVIGAAVGGETGAAAGFNATANNYLTVADLSKKETTKERQERSLANNAVAENACLNADAKTCNGALSTVATNIKDLKDYKKQLEENAAQTTDGKAAAQLSMEVGTVDKQIESAKNVVRVGLMALDNGNFDIRTMSDSDLIGMGVAFDAAGAAELRAASKVKTVVSNLIDNAKTAAANATEVAAAKISNNANRDGGCLIHRGRCRPVALGSRLRNSRHPKLMPLRRRGSRQTPL